MNWTIGALYPGVYSSVRMSFPPSRSFELLNPLQFVLDESLISFQHNRAKRPGPSGLFQFREFLDASRQKCLPSSNDFFPFLLRQEIEHCNAKEKRPVIRRISFSKRRELLQQILLAGHRDPILLALLPAVALNRALFHPARLDELL